MHPMQYHKPDCSKAKSRKWVPRHMAPSLHISRQQVKKHVMARDNFTHCTRNEEYIASCQLWARNMASGSASPIRNLHHCNSSPACNRMSVPLMFILGKDNSNGNMTNSHSHSPEHHHGLSAEVIDIKDRRHCSDKQQCANYACG